MKFKFYPILFLVLLAGQNIFGQTVGDYRSAASGLWSALTTWERFNGTTWVQPTAAQGYAGQNANANTVSIIGGFTVTLDASVVIPSPWLLNQVIVSGSGSILSLDGNRSLNTLALIVENNGVLEWSNSAQGNKALQIPDGSALILRTGGRLVTGVGQANCSASQQLLIGNCVYASCNGQGSALYDFPTVQSNGGTVNVTAASNTPVCLTNTILLSATANGVINGSITFSWSGPASFTSTLEDPTRPNATLAMAGNYQVTLTNIAGSGNKTCTLSNVATIPVDVTRLNTWTGAIDSLWSKPGNWSCNAVPVYESDVQIPAVFNNPILDINYTVGFNMLMSGPVAPTSPTQANSLVIAPNATLAVDATTNFAGYKVTVRSNATGTGSIGRISGNFVSGDNNFVVERFIPGTKRRWNLLTIPVDNSTATIRDVWGGGSRPRVGNSSFNGSIYLPNPFPGAIGDYVAGDATIITGHRHIDATSANSLGFDWWPELIIPNVGPNGNLTATSPSSIRPYKHGLTNNTGTGFASNWEINTGYGGGSLVNQTVNAAIARHQGFLLYTRGDRSVLHDRFAATTLRPFGALKKFAQTALVSPKGADPLSPVLSVVGNPYPSPVNFETLRGLAINTGIIENYFWYWDSNLPGNTGDGGFRLVTQVGPGSWVATPVVSGAPITNNVQMISSGQAILVEGTAAPANGGLLTFTEDVKSTTNNAVLPFEVEEGNNPATAPGMLFVNLQKGNNGTFSLVDGTLSVFGSDFTKGLGDANDVLKISNFVGNLSIAFNVDGKRLGSEAFPVPANNDKLQLDVAGLSAGQFALEFFAENLYADGRTAFLVDKFTQTETPLQLTGSTQYTFEVIANNAASSSPSRFEIVFKQSTVLPVFFTGITAAQQNADIAVKWSTSLENNLKHYTVEYSKNGRDFGKLANVTARNMANANYQFVHQQPGSGVHFYRVRSEDLDGKSLLTQVVKVDISNGAPGFGVFPTIIGGANRVSLQLTSLNKGTYNIQLTDMSGRVLQTQAIQHDGGSASFTLQLPAAIASGKYNVRLNGEGQNFVQSVVKE